MFLRFGPLTAAALTVFTAALAVDASGQTPATTQTLVKEGVALHDQGRYDDAIEKYKAALREDPENAAAFYEMSLSLMLKGDARECIRCASEGLKRKSPLEGQLYSTLGSCQDMAGSAKDAIETFKKGIKRAPGDAMLHFNLGVTCERTGKHSLAREALRESLSRQPRHPGSHLALAKTYVAQGYRIPALMAAITFLVLEPASPRSATAIQIVQQCLGGLVKQRAGSKDVNITLNAAAPTDEGDYMPGEMMLAMSLAPVGKDAKESEFDRLSGAISTMSSALANMSCKGRAFACRHYVPFFAAAAERDLAPAMMFRALQGAGVKGKDEWGAANAGKLPEFETLLRDHRWPDPR